MVKQMSVRNQTGFPEKVGLYDPAQEHDSCGVGFVAHIKGQRSHKIVQDAYTVLKSMEHRGACGCESNSGDGAGIMTALEAGDDIGAFGQPVDDLALALVTPLAANHGVCRHPNSPPYKKTYSSPERE